MARSAGLPSPDQILEFLRTADAKAGKREIARAFGIKGADRIELKRLLRKMADDGLIASRRKRLADASSLPPVTVLRIAGIVLFSVTLVKIFFFDLVSLSILSRTILFLALGVLLLLTSYLYQRYKEQL